MKDDFLILLTNDDGVGAPGLAALEASLRQVSRVVVVAPSEEKSGVSHALTIHQPIRILEKGPDRFAVTGTPADCVIFACTKILSVPPNLVISGINNGPNLGDDVHYSGTVAGAREAALRQIPAIAVSLASRFDATDFGPAAEFVRVLVEQLSLEVMPAGTYWNINVPEGEIKGYRFTRQGSRLVFAAIEEKRDPRGRPYYWIGRDDSEGLPEPDTDYEAIKDQVVSITPLQPDHTDYRVLSDYLRGSCKLRFDGEPKD